MSLFPADARRTIHRTDKQIIRVILSSRWQTLALLARKMLALVPEEKRLEGVAVILAFAVAMASIAKRDGWTWMDIQRILLYALEITETPSFMIGNPLADELADQADELSNIVRDIGS